MKKYFIIIFAVSCLLAALIIYCWPHRRSPSPRPVVKFTAQATGQEKKTGEKVTLKNRIVLKKQVSPTGVDSVTKETFQPEEVQISLVDQKGKIIGQINQSPQVEEENGDIVISFDTPITLINPEPAYHWKAVLDSDLGFGGAYRFFTIGRFDLDAVFTTKNIGPGLSYEVTRNISAGIFYAVNQQEPIGYAGFKLAF